MKRIITLFFLLVFACSLSAQVETRGSDFWVAFGNNANAQPTAGVFLQLRIVAKQAVTGKITFTENDKVVPFSVSENGVFNYTLTDDDIKVSYTLKTGTNSKSIRIQTDNDIPVTVYAFNTYQALADATNLLPVSTLGSDYYHLGRAAVGANFTDNYMVVATQDNTIVYENGTDVAHLSKGQVYFRRANNMSQDLSGFHITSNHPIAYFSAHNYHQIDGGGDNIFQQLTSIETWGTKFIVPVSLRGVELVRVVASHNNTKVTQTGGTLPKSSTPAPQTYTLNAGEFVEFQISLANKGCYIESDKPVQVCSYMVGMNYGNGAIGNGDESLVWIPPIEQSVQTALIAPFGSGRLSTHYALIVTPTATKEKTTIKIGSGQTMLLSNQNGQWYDNPSSGMSFYNLQLKETSASYIFDNEEGLIVYGYGFGSYISYYYMAASSIRQLNPSFYINDIHFQNANGQTYCNGSFKFKAELNFTLSSNPGHIKWYINGIEEPNTQDKMEWTKPSLPLNTPQEIKLVVIGDDGKSLTITSTITVVDPKPLKITGELFICPPAKNTVLTAESGPTRYQWYYNGQEILGAIENTYTVTPDKAGKYSVVGSYGKCTSPMSDTVTVVDGCNATLDVTYNGNGNDSGTAPVDDKSPYVDDAEVTVKGKGDMKRTDATFIGWSFTQKQGLIMSKNDEPTDLKKENDKFVIKTDTTLYATWAVDKKGPNGKGDDVPDYLQMGVTYNGNENSSGAAPTDDNLYNANTEVAVKDSGTLVRTNAAFVGWSFTKKGLITKASDVPSDLKLKDQKFTITSDTTLFAVWGEDKTGPNGQSDGIPDYLQKGITYNGNKNTSGDAPVDNNRYNSGTPVAVKDSGTLVRTEAVFLGWSFAQKELITKAADEPSDLKKTGTTFTITADTTLFAVWAIDKTGPNGKPDGKPDYAQDGVTYNGNQNTGGTAPTDPKLYNDNDDVTVLDKGDLVRTNAVFLGWLFEAKPLITKKADVPTGILIKDATFKYSSNNRTLYALWGEDKTGPNGNSDNIPDYLQNGVIYHGNDNTGGTAPVDNNRYNNGENVTVKDSGSLVRTQAVFIGWSFTRKVGVIEKAEDEPSDLKQKGATFASTSDTTLYAVWAVDKTGPNGKPDGKPDYSQDGVTYYGNDNTSGDAPKDNSLYNIGDKVTAKDKGTLVRTNAVFIGWLFNSHALVTKAADVPAGMTQPGQQFDYTSTTNKLYAIWGEDKTGPNGNSDDIPDYLQKGVTYDGNGNGSGTAPVDPKRYNDNDAVTVLGKNDLARDKAAFVGWSFGKQNLLTTKAEQDAVTDLKKPTETFTITTDTTLFAVWGEDKTGPSGTPDDVPDYLQMGVTYNGNGGTGAAPKDDNRYNSGTAVMLKPQTPLTRNQAVFIGWSFGEHLLVETQAAQDAITDRKQPGETFTITADTTLYAVWAVDKTGPNGQPDGKPDYAQKGLTYDGNHQTSGTAPQDASLYNDGDQVTVKDKGDLVRTNAVFIGWNFTQKDLIQTAADVPADMKQPNDKFNFASATSTLYAVWAEDKTGPNGQSDDVPDYLQKGVTYHGNGNTSGTAPVDNNRYNDSTMVTLKDKGDLTRNHAVFIGWTLRTPAPALITEESEADGIKGDLIQPGSQYLIRNDLTFHAVWAADANDNGIPDYDEVEITWNPGLQPRAGRQWTQTVAKGAYKFTNSGFTIRGFVLIGWSDKPKQVVRSAAAESSVKPLHKVGETLNIQAKTVKFFAVWAVDSNNDGVPDYKGTGGNLSRAPLLRGESEDQVETPLDAATIRVWAHDGTLYIESDRRVRAEVYTRSGALYKRIEVAEGQTREPLASGFYVVAIDGKRYKVFVK